MREDSAPLDWSKSSFSSLQGCVEVAGTAEGNIALRDSKHPEAGHHVYTPHEWWAFLQGARHGEFDHLLNGYQP